MSDDWRIEHDSLGEVRVPADRYWGPQTQRAVEHFPIGVGRFRWGRPVIAAFGSSSWPRRAPTRSWGSSPPLAPPSSPGPRTRSSTDAGRRFPARVWQTGSGTQSNMNANEVIATRANELAGGR